MSIDRKLAIHVFIKGRSLGSEFPLRYSQAGSEFEYKRVGHGIIQMGMWRLLLRGIKQTWAIYWNTTTGAILLSGGWHETLSGNMQKGIIQIFPYQINVTKNILQLAFIFDNYALE